MKRTPALYKQEMQEHLAILKEKLEHFKEQPGSRDTTLEDYVKFMAHISGIYRENLADYLSTELINLLQQYYSVLNPALRMSMVTALKIMRGKDVCAPSIVIPVLIKLFRCEDKHLRKFLHSVIVSDLKKLNKNAKVVNINRRLQNFIYGMLEDVNEQASKRGLSLMIELYKRRIWNDDKAVNVIARGCLHENTKIVVSACKFFLLVDYDYDSDDESSDEDAADKIGLLKQRKGSKMTKHREAKLEKAIK